MSTLTFSVSSCTSGSPASTCSPWRFSQAPTVASTIDSPKTGTRTSVGMNGYSFEHFGHDAVLLLALGIGPSLGRAGPLRAADVAHGPVASQIAQARRHERPGAHVARLFLQPDDLLGGPIRVQSLFNLLGGERIQLFDPNDGQTVCLGRALRFQVGPDVAAAQHEPSDSAGACSSTRVVEARLESAVEQVASA